MGFFRLLLAVMVAMSHLGMPFHGLNQGVIAVVCFFLLSGYVMTALIDKHYSDQGKYGAFLLDRAMRLYPQFLLYLALTGIFVIVAHPDSSFLSGLTTFTVALNLLMIPIGYSAIFSSLSYALIIPPAATLGLEATFYIFFPPLLRKKLRALAAILSFAVFCFAYLNVIPTDTYGYRLLPGTLFIFLLGSFVRRTTRVEKSVAVVIYIACTALMLYAFSAPALGVPFNREVLVGVVLGTPILIALPRLAESPTDHLAGNLSYGVFLNHFLLIWLFQSAGFSIPGLTTAQTTIFIAISIGAAAASFFLVERPVISMRHRLRGRIRKSSMPVTASMTESQ